MSRRRDGIAQLITPEGAPVLAHAPKRRRGGFLAHEWSQDQSHIRFEVAPGQWGPWQRMRGDKGDVPAHAWRDGTLAFQQPDGRWGQFESLVGPAYLPEWDGTRLRFTRSDGESQPDVTAWKSLRGQKGSRGLPGPPPRHELTEDGIRFETHEGKWGEVIPICALVDEKTATTPVIASQLNALEERLNTLARTSQGRSATVISGGAGGGGTTTTVEFALGNWSPASGAYPTTTTRGARYVATDAATVDGVDYAVGDIITGLNAAPSTTSSADWAHQPKSHAAPATPSNTTPWNPATGTFPAGSLDGQVYRATQAGTIDGVTFATGDLLTALTDNASTTSYVDWTRTPHVHDAPPSTVTTAWTPSAGAFPAGSTDGQVYRATDAGTVDGVTFAAGDLLTALTDNASTASYADWTRTPHTHALPTSTITTAWSPATGTFPAGSADGQVYRATDAGTVDGVTFATGDLLTALADNASTTSYDDWTRTPHTHAVSAGTIETFDASTGAFPTPSLAANHYRASPGGTVDGLVIPDGAIVVPLVDNAPTTDSSQWTVLAELANISELPTVPIAYNALTPQVGIVHYVARFANTVPWTNPETSGQIVVSASTIGAGTTALLWDESTAPAFFQTQNIPDSHVRWSLPAGETAQVTDYVIRTSSVANRYPRNWRLEGSNNGGASWTTIDTRVADATINGPADTYFQFVAGDAGAAGFYNMFQLIQTGVNSSADNRLQLGRIEIFGSFKPGPVDTSGLKRARFDSAGRLVQTDEPVAVTSLPAFASVVSYARRLLVEQTPATDNGWWYASPGASGWVQVP